MEKADFFERMKMETAMYMYIKYNNLDECICLQNLPNQEDVSKWLENMKSTDLVDFIECLSEELLLEYKEILQKRNVESCHDVAGIPTNELQLYGLIERSAGILSELSERLKNDMSNGKIIELDFSNNFKA